MIKEIKAKDNKIVKYVYKLRNDRQFMKEEMKYVVEGDHFLDNLKSKDINFILTLKEIPNLNSIDQYIVSEEILKKLSVNKSFSKILVVMNIKLSKIEDLLKENGKTVIFLDNLQDPGNIGTILRTMVSFSFFDVVVTNYISLFNSKTLQASQGAFSFLNIYEGDVSTLKQLKDNSFTIISTTLTEDSVFLNDSQSIFKENSNKIVVFGNEGNGVSKDIIDISNYKIKIDMQNIDSLNVSIACAITLYQIKLFTK